LFIENSQNLIEQKQNEIKSLTEQTRTCSQEIDTLREQVNTNKKLSMDYEKQLDSIRRNILNQNSVNLMFLHLILSLLLISLA
jgi:peptidoglycan hydrolase CwlO-like protein